VAQRIVANSPWLQQQAVNFFGRDAIECETWPVPPLKPAFHGPKIGFFGHSGPVKGMRVLLEAARRLPDYQFVLFTDMPEQFCENRRVFGIDNIVVMGKYVREDLPKLVNLVTIVVVPSICESYGLVARECIALGKRVIATDVGGMADIGTIEGNNVEALVTAIKAVL
jgi:glycosyltransferase involved in cell wall biosynthesis